MENLAILFQGIACGLNQMTVSARKVTEVLRALGDQIAVLRPIWLATDAGEWPDRFVLLNRYLRTGCEPEYFTESRTILA